MLTTRFVIISTIVYIISIVNVIVLVNSDLMGYMITIISLFYLISISLRILSAQNHVNVEGVTVKEPRSKLEHIQSLIDQINRKKSNVAFMLITEEIRAIGVQIVATYFKVNTAEIRSLPLEKLSGIMSIITAKVIKGESQIHNKQELLIVINDLKRILQMD